MNNNAQEMIKEWFMTSMPWVITSAAVECVDGVILADFFKTDENLINPCSKTKVYEDEQEAIDFINLVKDDLIKELTELGERLSLEHPSKNWRFKFISHDIHTETFDFSFI